MKLIVFVLTNMQNNLKKNMQLHTNLNPIYKLIYIFRYLMMHPRNIFIFVLPLFEFHLQLSVRNSY